jgi:phosphoribosylformylglycinamidine (FGAM) synthase PurS component
VTEEAEFDLKALLGLPDEEPQEPTEFAKSVGAALARAIAAMRAEEVIEVEAANVDALVAEATDAALESASLKRLLKRVVNTLVHSDLVEEVYGTDDELASFLRRFFEGD